MFVSLTVHILSFNDEDLAPYVFRHWSSFAEKMIVHDGSLGKAEKLLGWAHLYGAEVIPWHTDGVNDELAMKLKNECWRQDTTDWVAVVDFDELLYFPKGVETTIAAYDRLGAAMIRPHGFELFSDEYPKGYRQIYDEIKTGTPDDKWYGKPVLFNRKNVIETGFGVGAHEAHPMFVNGRRYRVDGSWPFANPETYLLHCHHLGGVERCARRYAEQQSRHSRCNILHQWGNFEDPMKHAMDKRAKILPGLTQIIF